MFNVTSPKRYIGDVVPTPDPIKLEDCPENKVDAILHHWWVSWWHTYLEYLVFFVGYDASHNEGLLAANLANVLDIPRSYQIAHGLA